MHARRPHRDDGFTMTELMIVVLILAILVSIAFATSNVADARARAAPCLSNQRICEDAVLTYRLEHDGDLPAALADADPYIHGGGGHRFCTEDETLDFVYDAATGRVSCTNHPGP
jgi:prepilin-type N-terminal cleavage/methylation domain-containing protein